MRVSYFVYSVLFILYIVSVKGQVLERDGKRSAFFVIYFSFQHFAWINMHLINWPIIYSGILICHSFVSLKIKNYLVSADPQLNSTPFVWIRTNSPFIPVILAEDIDNTTLSCSTFKDCTGCTNNWRCNWCESTLSCVEGRQSWLTNYTKSASQLTALRWILR